MLTPWISNNLHYKLLLPVPPPMFPKLPPIYSIPRPKSLMLRNRGKDKVVGSFRIYHYNHVAALNGTQHSHRFRTRNTHNRRDLGFWVKGSWEKLRFIRVVFCVVSTVANSPSSSHSSLSSTVSSTLNSLRRKRWLMDHFSSQRKHKPLAHFSCSSFSMSRLTSPENRI